MVVVDDPFTPGSGQGLCPSKEGHSCRKTGTRPPLSISLVESLPSIQRVPVALLIIVLTLIVDPEDK